MFKVKQPAESEEQARRKVIETALFNGLYVVKIENAAVSADGLNVTPTATSNGITRIPLQRCARKQLLALA